MVVSLGVLQEKMNLGEGRGTETVTGSHCVERQTPLFAALCIIVFVIA